MDGMALSSHLTNPEVHTPAIPSADTGETQRYSLVVVERENLTDNKMKECVLWIRNSLSIVWIWGRE